MCRCSRRWIRNESRDLRPLFLGQPARRIHRRVRQEVTAINPAEKTVTVHALDSEKIYTETYDKLLLAPGAKPTVPALSGVSGKRVFTLRTVEGTIRIRHFVEEQKPKTAVLAGDMLPL